MFLHDIRYALRSLLKAKGFAAVAILCLGFGIGLNATIFSILDGVILQPYPYPDPDQLLVVGEQNPKSDYRGGLSYLDMEDQGFLLVLTKVQVRYRSPARYDDVLTLRTTVLRTTLVKIEHRYELARDGLLLAEGETTLGCVDRDGKVQALPPFLQVGRDADPDVKKSLSGLES